MNESGATLFEVQQLARHFDDPWGKIYMNLPRHYRNAIIAEALMLLAEKKEAEQRAA